MGRQRGTDGDAPAEKACGAPERGTRGRGVVGRTLAAPPDRGAGVSQDHTERPVADRDDGDLDPLDEAPAPDPRYAVPLVVAAYVLAVLAVMPTGAAFVIGPVGMACGLIAHAKGERRGFTAGVVAGVATVIGLSIQFLLLGGITGEG